MWQLGNLAEASPSPRPLRLVHRLPRAIDEVSHIDLDSPNKFFHIINTRSLAPHADAVMHVSFFLIPLVTLTKLVDYIVNYLFIYFYI